MTGWSETEEAFSFRGEALGAMVFRVGYPEPEDGPNWLVLFPSGYVEPVEVRDPSETTRPVPDEVARKLATRHHPMRFVSGKEEAEAYWRKRAHHFPGGGRHGA